ncbi:MAG: hypothetical protein V2A58_04175 [Planctomycetota bacterium]
MRVAWLILIACACAGCARPGTRPADAPSGPAVAGWGGPGRTDGRFYKPRAVAVNGDRAYIVDMSGRIQVFGTDGAWRESWKLEEVSRGYPTGLGIGPEGRLGVADTHNYAVRIYSPQGRLLGTIGKEGGGPGEFTYLTDVEFDPSGDFYVSEHGRHCRIQKFDPEGNFILEWGEDGDRPGDFHRPQALAIDRDGSVYVADAGNHRVQKFTGDGKLLAVLGGPGRGPGELLYPYDLALGPSGRLAVCEYGNNRVQIFDADGNSVAILGGPGRELGRLAGPWAVAWLGDDRILVADTDNHRLQVFGVAAPTLH